VRGDERAFGGTPPGPALSPPSVAARRIVKPVGQSRGRGIRMVHSMKQLTEGPGGLGTPDDPLVAQRYVTNPMMVQVGCMCAYDDWGWLGSSIPSPVGTRRPFCSPALGA